MAYQQPGVTVDQNLTTTPTSIERDQPAFVFGPNYELHRYSDADEKQGTYVGAYSGKEMNVRYPGVIDVDNVDKSYTKLTGDNVVVELADLAEVSLPEESSVVAVNGGYTKLFFAGKRYVKRDVNGESDVVSDLPQEIVAGDLIQVSYENSSGNVDVISKVVSIEYTPGDSDDGSSSPAVAEGTTITIDGVIPEDIQEGSVSATIVVVENGVEFSDKDLGHGSGYQWDQPDTEIESGDEKFFGVRIKKLSVPVNGYFADKKFYEVLSADLYVTYRELNTTYSDTIHSLIGESAVEQLLGKATPDNPLALGVKMAALNSATDDGDEAPPVYFMAVPSDNISGYDSVLNKASLTNKVYTLSPVTRDGDVLEKVRNHCLEMSSNVVKQWRIAVVSAEVPSTVDRLNSKFDPQGDDFLAIPVSASGTAVDRNATYSMLRIVKDRESVVGNPDVSLFSTVAKGDKVRFGYHKNGWGELVYDTYTVRRVVNNFTVEVYLEDRDGDAKDDGIDLTYITGEDSASHFDASKIEIFHTYTAAETADLVASISKSFASRRMYNVFPSVFGSNGVTMSGEFAACAVAGLISGTEPQQPITNMTVRGIDDIPMIYQVFNREQLNTMAAGGTFIIAQDMPNDLVYVRHQISTAYPEGNLNTAELSITKNVDSISYAFAEVFRPYYGKNNITPDLLATLDNRTKDLVSQFARSTSVYGPQLIAEETEIRYVRQNKLMKDHTDIVVKVGVPYPCNNIDIVLTV